MKTCPKKQTTPREIAFKIYWLIFVFSAIILFASSPALAAESCYIGLVIQENKTQQGSIQFTLLETSNLYGDYEGFVDYFPGDYSLRTYDGAGKVLNSYPLQSVRFVYWDDFNPDTENPGGVQEVDSGFFSIIIPYNSRISKIKVENNGVETDLNINPGAFKCEKPLIEENQPIQSVKENQPVEESQIVSLPREKWCSNGLIPIKQPDDYYICVNCGDKVCSRYEDYYSCPKDCPSSLKQLFVDLKLNLSNTSDWQDSIPALTPLEGISLKAVVTGTVTDLTNYKFDCESDDFWDYTYDNISNNPKIIESACSYAEPGVYTAKVKVERAGLSAEDEATITVNAVFEVKTPLDLYKIISIGLISTVSLVIVILALFIIKKKMTGI